MPSERATAGFLNCVDSLPSSAGFSGAVQPYAWQSREFLRKMLIGKIVSFHIDYTNPSIKREFGTIMLDDVNVNKQVVQNGWCKLRTLGAKDSVTEYAADPLASSFINCHSFRSLTSPRACSVVFVGTMPSCRNWRRRRSRRAAVCGRARRHPMPCVRCCTRGSTPPRRCLPSYRARPSTVHLKGPYRPRL